MIGSYGLCLCHQLKVGFFLDFTPFSKTHSLCNIQQHFPYSESEIGGKRSVKSKNVSGSRFHFIIIRCFGLQQHLHMLIQFIVLRLHIHSDRSAMTLSTPKILFPTNNQTIASSLTFYNRDYVSSPLSFLLPGTVDLIPEYPWLVFRSRIQQNLRMLLHQSRNKRRAKISTVHSYGQSKLSTQTIKRTGRIVHFFTRWTEQLHAVVSK